jgi:hypothetical protein
LEWFNEHASTTLFQPPISMAEVEELSEKGRAGRAKNR